jgi:uncharacterized membrane protein
MSDAGPVERARENLTGIVSTLVTGIWLAALFTGQEWWLAFMLFGYIVVVPIVAMLFGDDEEGTDHWEQESQTTESSDAREGTDEALETLRERYARGEITEEQFERKVERLLETETLEDVEDQKRRAEKRRDPGERQPEYE